MSMCISRVALSLLSTMKLSYQRIHVNNRRRSGGPGGDPCKTVLAYLMCNGRKKIVNFTNWFLRIT